jgi:hypothetical protein
MMKALALLAAVGVGVVGLPAPAATAAPPDVRPSEISGTVRLYGCPVEPAQVELRAQALGIALPDGPRHLADPRASQRQVVAEPTENPQVHRFSIRGLRPGVMYGLQARLLPPNPCRHMLWRAPLGGLAVSGGPPVAVEGLAVRTTLEVQSGRGAWVGADELVPGGSETPMRRFRWGSTLPGVVGGEVQISTVPFTAASRPDPCAEPQDGVVHRSRVGLGPDGAGEFEVDVGALLGDGRTDGGPPPALSDSELRLLEAGAPLSVRVVPITAAGPACDPDEHGSPGTAALAKIPGGTGVPPQPAPPLPPVIPGDGHHYAPPYTGGPAEGHPTYGERAYKIIRPHVLPATKCEGLPAVQLFLQDPFGCLLVNSGAAPGSTVGPGLWFYFWPGSGGDSGGFADLVSQFGNLVTGALDAAGVLVDTLGAIWEDIKTTVAQIVVDVVTWAVPGVEDLCQEIASHSSESCDSLVKKGIEVGLMAMGVPPTLPSWEELKDQGVEYLAAEIATQVEASTGIPSSVSEQVIREVAQEAVDRMTAERGVGSGPALDWIVPYLGFDPAVMTLSLREVGNAPVPDDLWLKKAADPLYAGASLPVPTVFPSTGVLRVPVVLQPNLSGIPSPALCHVPAGGIACEPSAFPVPVECTYFGIPCPKDWVGMYFRDRWVGDRFHMLPCVKLQTDALLVAGGLALWSPSESFTITARVQPPVPASWDGATFAAC